MLVRTKVQAANVKVFKYGVNPKIAGRLAQVSKAISRKALRAVVGVYCTVVGELKSIDQRGMWECLTYIVMKREKTTQWTLAGIGNSA